jgi:hypothetical protein
MAHLTDLWLVEWWLARRARRAALRFVRPYVARTRWRRGSDPGEAWMEPYALGFLTGLITLVARPLMGGARGEVLGLVQAEAWAALTGLPSRSTPPGEGSGQGARKRPGKEPERRTGSPRRPARRRSSTCGTASSARAWRPARSGRPSREPSLHAPDRSATVRARVLLHCDASGQVFAA